MLTIFFSLVYGNMGFKLLKDLIQMIISFRFAYLQIK